MAQKILFTQYFYIQKYFTCHYFGYFFLLTVSKLVPSTKCLKKNNLKAKKYATIVGIPFQCEQQKLASLRK